MNRAWYAVLMLSVVVIVGGVFAIQAISDSSEGDSDTSETVTATAAWNVSRANGEYTMSKSWDMSERYVCELTSIKPVFVGNNIWTVGKLTDNSLTMTYGDTSYELGSYSYQSGSVAPVDRTVNVGGGGNSDPVFDVSWYLYDKTVNNANTIVLRVSVSVSNSDAVTADSLGFKLSVTGPPMSGTNSMTRTPSVVIPISHTKSYDLISDQDNAVQFYEPGFTADEFTEQKKLRTDYGNRITASEAGKLILLAVYPSDGGKISSVDIKDASGNDVSATMKTAYTTKTDGSGGLETVEGTQHVYFFTMPSSNVTVKVAFNSHALTVGSTNGTVKYQLYGTTEGEFGTYGAYSAGSPEAMRINSTYFAGDTIRLTATPDEGYEFDRWDVVSGGVTVSNDGRFTMGDQPVALNAVFKAKEYKITCSSVSNGTIIAPAAAVQGQEVAVTVAPASGYLLDTLTLTYGSTTTDIASSKSFTMPASDVTITATFRVDDSRSTMACTSSVSGANTVLDLIITCRNDASSLQDARILVVAKYGTNVVNVYSKPVIENGSGTDRIVVSTAGLTEVVMQLVDGIQPADDGKVSYVCFCSYEPSSTTA